MFRLQLQVHNETVQLHLVAALQSLHRESELLPAAQREVLTVMLREHGLTAGMQTASNQPLGHRRSFTGSSDGSISSGHLVAGSQSLPGLPRASAGVTRRPSDASQGTCLSSADAVALQRTHLGHCTQFVQYWWLASHDSCNHWVHYSMHRGLYTTICLGPDPDG